MASSSSNPYRTSTPMKSYRIKRGHPRKKVRLSRKAAGHTQIRI
jgi:hypothetical protein